jgi:hypothetical protein
MGHRGRSDRMVVGYTTTCVIKVVSSNHDHGEVYSINII